MSNRHFSSLCLFVVLALCPAAGAQIRQQQHDQLRAALDRNDQPAAERILAEMATLSPPAFARNNYDYLQGRLLERRGALAEAASLFSQVIERNSPLAGYALWHQAEIARAAGNADREQRLLSRFLSQYSDHLYRERAIERLADSQYKSGQYQNVISTLRLLSGPRRDTMAMIGDAQAELRQTDAARSLYASVLANGSLDDASLRAAEGLDHLDEQSMAAISEADRLKRARVYQYNRHFPEARNHWLALVRQFPASPRRAETLFQIGRGYFLENNFAESAKWYQRAYDEFPQTDEGEQGFYYVGHCSQFLDDADRAIARYEAYLKEFPEGSFIGYAHLNAIDTLRSAGRLDEALQWAVRAQTISREAFIATSALFQQARIRLSQENYQAALADFTLLKSRNLNARGLTASTNLPEVSYMRGYCLQKLGKNEEAAIEFLALAEGRSGASAYYGWRASERLRSMGGNPATRNLITGWREKFLGDARAAMAQGNALQAKNAAYQALRLTMDGGVRDEIFRILRAAYAKLPGYQIPSLSIPAAGRLAPIEANEAAAGTTHLALANELLFLGLIDEGAAELLAGSTLTQTTAFYCSRGPCAHRTLDYSEPSLKRLPEDFRLELLSSTLAEMFYPIPYRDSLDRHATTRAIDLRFILSIIRQESSYEPRIKSASAARGMMQFIASTANIIASQLALRDFEQNDLYEPDIAILFGSQYIKNLNDEFGSGQAVAASYNGSEESVRRWRARSRSKEVDRLVIEIAKRETKDYVYKVMNNYNAYRNLYPDRFKR